VVTDAQGNNVYVSPNCDDITGYTQEELLGGMGRWVHEDDTPRAREAFERAFREGVRGKDFEYKAVRKDGDLWYASSSWEPLRDEKGKLQDVVLQTIDITERVRAEEKLKQTVAELERSNADLARFNRLAVGRELRMIELKRQINELSEGLGREPPYDLSLVE